MGKKIAAAGSRHTRVPAHKELRKGDGKTRRRLGYKTSSARGSLLPTSTSRSGAIKGTAKGTPAASKRLPKTRPDDTVARYVRAVSKQIETMLLAKFKGTPSATARRLPSVTTVARSVVDLIPAEGAEEQNELASVVGPVWPRKTVMEKLQIPTPQALQSRRDNGSILGVKTSDGHVVYPVSQFCAKGGEVVVKPGLIPLLRALRGQPAWSVAVLLETPAPELGGLSPLEWEREGRGVDALKQMAKAVSAEWGIPTKA